MLCGQIKEKSDYQIKVAQEQIHIIHNEKSFFYPKYNQDMLELDAQEYILAIEDFNKLKSKVEKFEGSTEELLEYLGTEELNIFDSLVDAYNYVMGV
jgi:DNA/RNA-binding domain of Phe-tRNA-synthetase-like protein